MILKVFAVRDMKAEAFLQPFFSPSVGSALRAFSDAVNDKQCPFNKHPGDYVLYEIGSYDDSTAELGALPVVKMFSAGSDLIDVRSSLADTPTTSISEIREAFAEANGKK